MNNDELNNKLKQIINRGAAKISSQNYLEAEKLLKSGEKIDEQNPEVLYNLAVLYLKQNKYIDALKYLQKVKDLPFTSVDIIQVDLLKCYSYLELKRYNECGPVLIGLLSKVPNNTQILSLLGYYYEKIEKPDQAIDAYKKCLDIDKNNINAHNSYAYLLAVNNKDLNTALSSARRCIHKDSENPSYLDTIGYIHIKRGESDMAKKYLTKALKKMPSSEIIKEHLNELLGI